MALETNIQAIYRLNMLYLGLKIYTYVHAHICIYMRIYLYNNNQKKKDTMSLKKSREGYMGVFGGRKEKGEMM